MKRTRKASKRVAETAIAVPPERRTIRWLKGLLDALPPAETLGKEIGGLDLTKVLGIPLFKRTEGATEARSLLASYMGSHVDPSRLESLWDGFAREEPAHPWALEILVSRFGVKRDAVGNIRVPGLGQLEALGAPGRLRVNKAGRDVIQLVGWDEVLARVGPASQAVLFWMVDTHRQHQDKGFPHGTGVNGRVQFALDFAKGKLGCGEEAFYEARRRLEDAGLIVVVNAGGLVQRYEGLKPEPQPTEYRLSFVGMKWERTGRGFYRVPPMLDFLWAPPSTLKERAEAKRLEHKTRATRKRGTREPKEQPKGDLVETWNPVFPGREVGPPVPGKPGYLPKSGFPTYVGAGNPTIPEQPHTAQGSLMGDRQESPEDCHSSEIDAIDRRSTSPSGLDKGLGDEEVEAGAKARAETAGLAEMQSPVPASWQRDAILQPDDIPEIIGRLSCQLSCMTEDHWLVPLIEASIDFLRAHGEALSALGMSNADWFLLPDGLDWIREAGMVLAAAQTGWAVEGLEPPGIVTLSKPNGKRWEAPARGVGQAPGCLIWQVQLGWREQPDESPESVEV